MPRNFLSGIIVGIALLSFPLAALAGKSDFDNPTVIEAVDRVHMERMTWMEVRDAMTAGAKTVIVPTGGIEPNGPYLETGKHQIILEATTERIARKLGNTLVGPTVSFVPEGQIDPPTGHMHIPGTFSVSHSTFQILLADIANTLRVHGFEHIILIGDSGGNQTGMEAVAKGLSKEWQGKINKFGKTTNIYYIKEYYDNPRWNQWIKDQGINEVREGIHDDVRHTSIMMSVNPQSVRLDQRIKAGKTTINTVSINPPDAMIALGKRLVEHQTDVTVKAIKKAIKKATSKAKASSSKKPKAKK